MAYLNFTASNDNSNTCFKFIGSETKSTTTNLITNTTSLLATPTTTNGMDTCSFYAGGSDAAIIAFGENYESCGSIALSGSESTGAIAYSGSGESCGSIASSFSSSSSFSSGGSSYSYSC